MTSRSIFCAIATTAALGMLEVAPAGQAPGPTDDAPILYHQVDFRVQMPAGRPLTGSSAIDIDVDGTSVWLADRCGENCAGSQIAPILRFDASGKVVAALGAGLFSQPHGIHVDGQGNVWITDSLDRDGKGQQVLKLSPDGKVLLRLGRAGVAGEGPDTFNQPSDVVTAPNGDIFVGDGHGGKSNSRIVKFSKDGTFIKAWGKRGTAPGDFASPHALAMDAKGRLLVADRGNNRIQAFDQDGTFLEEWKQFGNPSGIAIDPRGMLHSTDMRGGAGWGAGVRVGSLADGKITAFFPDLEPVVPAEGREAIAVARDGTVYIAKTGRGGLLKLVKK